MSIDEKQIEELLQKAKEIKSEIEVKKEELQKIGNEIIRQNTKKEQILEELKQYGVTEENLEQKIEEQYQVIKDGIESYQKLCG